MDQAVKDQMMLGADLDEDEEAKAAIAIE